MGYIQNVIKGGVNSSIQSIKNANIMGHINSGVSSLGDSLGIPKTEIPDAIKNFKPNYAITDLNLPVANISSYISPVASGILSGIELPSELGGIPLPEMPDLSSVTEEVNGYISGFGIDTNALGIRSVSDILKNPDLTELKDVTFEDPVDLDNMPDLTKSLDAFNISEAQKDIDSLTSKIPGIESLDLSQYF